ncbi:alpha-amylase/4-alpha-glucanotransferase domain-containing protein [Candidatus Nitrotoga sp. M5]|uniref:alpha-amylase/4-alpha-glucanotransferase domain-containing protein n=1 Tax=Candidatus Nitrotoga sp. M5 TaxID=2890409 RepID=UPI001EF69EBC|nr:alpha-amylase/4-alpha-glucanotransferase domain-containing protein [Candidatus Nitrotoga sp. M5]CAH1387729.1 4-alpha-glucanotransferase [Candidatus Nitrotoga sp. M5]
MKTGETVSLLFGVHAHQPVGNFPEVVDDAHQRCYKPFLHILHRYPDFRFAVHFSGWLLDYLFNKYPQDMALLTEMVKRGQVEMFGGGDTEPVLAVIPNRDRIGQIVRLSDKLEARMGTRAQGAWLTERVWEATVVPALSDSKIEYVTVDDYHFLCSGKRTEELNGYFTTEEDGRKLDLFPISEALRYRMPFSPAHEVVAYLESLTRNDQQASAVYFDDIEKFGIWPETYQWVYEQGWLENFIRGVLASSKIASQTYYDYHAGEKTRGIVYLPTTSYIEMNEWTLPMAAAHTYADLVNTEKSGGHYEERKAFLRGGIWKNFFTRYPESNWMHKRMLGLSERLHALPEEKRSLELLDQLYIAQANDAYWHGLFGGLYLPHLRRAVYGAIVKLEFLLDQILPRAACICTDADSDGHDEIFLHNAMLQAIVKLDGSASISELDAYQLHHNFGDTLRRQSEHYFRKIESSHAMQPHNGSGIVSAHDRVAFKHEITAENLMADSHALTIFRDYLRQNGEEVELAYELVKTNNEEMVFRTELDGKVIKKHIRLNANCLCVSYTFASALQGSFLTRVALAMPSCDGYSGRYIQNEKILSGFGSVLELTDLDGLVLDDGILGGNLVLNNNYPIQLHGMPYFTVSQSEAGFEKIMQAVMLTLQWPLSQSEMSIKLTIKPGNEMQS